MKELQATKREAIFIRTADAGPALVKAIIKRYTFDFYDDKACDGCEWRPERHTDVCDNCASFKGSYQLASKVKVNENPYVKVPVGDFPRFKSFMRNKGFDLKVKSKSPRTKIKPIEFTGTLRDYQVKAVNVLFDGMRGILKSLPRSGKTVMASALVCKVGMKTLILASQRDWLVGFHETFVGSKTQKPLTNLNPSRIGYARKLEDFVKYDICLTTVQTFWSEKGQKLLRRIRDMFPVLIIDEIQTSAADKYLMVMSRMNVRYSIGLSGTPSRKDMKMPMSNALLGPILHTTEVERLKAKVALVRTKYTRVIKGQVPWTYMVSHLERNRPRLNLIATTALRDMEAGHTVLIPMTRVKAITTLIQIINKKAGKRVAYPFHGGVKKAERDITITKARNGGIRILVGNTKLLSTGINIPRASMLYEVALSSNLENCEQRLSRILTPMEGKPHPVMKIFLDELGVRKRCLSNEWWNCIKPKFNPIISDVDLKVLTNWFKASTANAPRFIGGFL